MKKLILFMLPLFFVFSCDIVDIEGLNVNEVYNPSTLSASLKAPEDLRIAEELGYNKISWQANPSADAYYIIASDKEDGDYYIITNYIKANNWTDYKGSFTNKFYKIVSVKLFRNNKVYIESYPSDAIKSVARPIITSLAKPENVKARYIISDENYFKGVKLTWKAVANADYYRVQRVEAKNGVFVGDFEFIDTSNMEPRIIYENEFNDIYAGVGEYQYRVAAYKFDAGTQPYVESEFSSLLNIIGNTNKNMTVKFFGDVEAANLSYLEDEQEIKVNWKKGNALNYKVFKSLDGKNYTEIQHFENYSTSPDIFEYVETLEGSEELIYFKIVQTYKVEELFENEFQVDMDIPLGTRIGE